MHRTPKSARLRRRTGYATFLAAIIAAASLAAVAIAKTTTLSVAKNGKVSNQHKPPVTKNEPIAVSKGKAVYLLTGDSKRHSECTGMAPKGNGCLAIWLPVTVPNANSKPSVAKGIKGKLGVWNRTGLSGRTIHQVTLAGHPLYTFIVDTQKNHATGEGIVHFGGTWHAITATVSKAKSKNSAAAPPSMTPPPVMGPPAYP
jgi:predicted lipoprotein with Yx(FWY)xxD motif